MPAGRLPEGERLSAVGQLTGVGPAAWTVDRAYREIEAASLI